MPSLFPRLFEALRGSRLGGVFRPGGRRQNERNAAVAGLGAMINPVVQIVATPLIFHKLGPTQFGIWALITSVTAFSGLASLGLGEAATKYVALYRARADHGGVNRVIRTIGTLYLALGVATAVMVIAAAPWLSTALFHVEGREVHGAVTALRVAALGIVLRFLYGIVEAAVRGFERYDVESLWATLNAVTTSVLTVLCVQIGGGLTSVIAIGVVLTLLCAVGLGFTLARLTGSWTWTAPLLDKAAVREMWGFGVYSGIQNVNGMIVMQLDRVVIGAWLGAAMVGYYSVCLQLVNTAHVVLCRACAFLFPLLVKHREQGNHEAMWRLFKEGMIITTVLGWIFSSVFVVFGHDFLQIWMGRDFADQSGTLLQLLGAYNAFLATSIVPFFFLNATGREKQCTVLGLLGTGSFVVGAFFLIGRLGTVGAPLARFCMIWECVVYGAIMIRALAGDRRWLSAIATILPTVSALLIVGIFEALVPAPYAGAWSLRLVLLLVATMACAGLALWVYRRLLRFGAGRHAEPGTGSVYVGLEGIGKLGDA